MKKIIALAVASAFVAPVMAADISVSGEVEYNYTSADGLNTFSSDTQDVTITATEELGNGMTVTAFVRNDTGAGDAAGLAEVDSGLTIAGSFGSVEVGKDATQAGGAFDDKSDVTSGGGGADAEISDGVDTFGHVTLRPATGVDGLSIALGLSAADGTAEESFSYGAQYSVGGLTIAYGAVDTDLATDKTPSIVSGSFAAGPVYIGVDASKNIGGTDGTDSIGVGVTYSLGDLILGVERQTNKHATNIDATDTVYDITYNVGGGLQVYVSLDSDETASSATAKTSTDSTIVGVEYKF